MGCASGLPRCVRREYDRASSIFPLTVRGGPMTTTTRPEVLPQLDAAQHIFQVAIGYIASAALQVAVRLNIADLLADGPRSAADLAKATSVNEDALYRVLRALASLGVFTEVAPRTFGLTPPAD